MWAERFGHVRGGTHSQIGQLLEFLNGAGHVDFDRRSDEGRHAESKMRRVFGKCVQGSGSKGEDRKASVKLALRRLVLAGCELLQSAQVWEASTLAHVVEVEPDVAAPVKGWVSGNAGLHAGKPAPDPSRVDTSLGEIVFRRGGLAGSAEARLPAAAAGSSVISHPGFIMNAFRAGRHHTLCVTTRPTTPWGDTKLRRVIITRI